MTWLNPDENLNASFLWAQLQGTAGMQHIPFGPSTLKFFWGYLALIHSLVSSAISEPRKMPTHLCLQFSEMLAKQDSGSIKLRAKQKQSRAGKGVCCCKQTTRQESL